MGGTAEHDVTRQRLEGFRAALRERGLRFSDEQFVPTAFDEEAAYRALKALFATVDPVGGLFLNSLPTLDGLVRCFAEAPARCRPVHYGVFDYHPMMGLLHDLHIWVVKQDPQRMMRIGYGLLAPSGDGAPRLHVVPFELIRAGDAAAAGPRTVRRGARRARG